MMIKINSLESTIEIFYERDVKLHKIEMRCVNGH